MHIYSVTDPEFKPYGKILEGYDTAELLAAMEAIPLPEEGTAYRPGIESLEACAIFADFRDRAYGGMPIQLGMCWGHNTKLNCLEYHRDSEFNLGTEDFILLLAKMDDIVDDMLDTAKVKAFWCPKGVLIEVYATTLHYAPCHNDPAKGFRVLVGLPAGTNTDYRPGTGANTLDKSLWARNKWLLAHPESGEAAKGAYVGLKGINLDIQGDIPFSQR